MPTDELPEDLADRIAIREVMDEYCLRLEVNPFSEWLDLFTDDSVYEVHGKVLTGRQELSDTLSLAPHGVHIGGALRIRLDGDTAETVQNYVFHAENDRFSNNGWYYRTLVRTPAGWRISHTRVKMHKQTNKPLRPAEA